MTIEQRPGLPGLPGRTALAIGAIGLSALVLAVAIWPTGQPAGTEATAAPEVVQTQPSGALPDPSAAPALIPDEPWGGLTLAPPVAVATLAATAMDGDRVTTHSGFVLTSLGSTPAADLARAIVVSPSIDITVEPGADGATATIRPTAALEPGQLYRFTARTPDGAVAGSWAFQAAAPLQVVTTVPGDRSVNVPVTTGIELTVDQDGTLDLASHFSIAPAINGTFEQHGRTVVFVPDSLRPATFYTVTVSHGLHLDGSAQGLEEDVAIHFETAPLGATQDAPAEPSIWYGFPRPMVESSTRDRATLAVSISASAVGLERQPFAVAVYRLESEELAAAAVRALTDAPAWARWSAAGLVATRGLTRVARFTAHPQSLGRGRDSTFQLPTALDAGWYVIEIPRPARAAQAVLQVTDIGAYSAIATDRMLVWAADIVTGAPLVGATVEIVGGQSLGQTDGEGLLVSTTPDAIRLALSGDEPTPSQPDLAIRAIDGRSYRVKAGISNTGDGYLSDVNGYAPTGRQTSDYWHYLTADRVTYRTSDTINIWGFLRPRDGGRIPDHLQLVLESDASIKRQALRPDRSGAFTASIAFEDLPYGGYYVELTSGDLELGSIWFTVAEIRKPAYAITLATDRHVVVSGDPVTVTARAGFFDGTPVVGAKLAVELFEAHRAATTDRTGTAVLTGTPAGSGGIRIQPARSEEAEIGANTWLWVFPSSQMLEARATLADGRIDLTGSVNQVAISRLETAWATAPWSGDPKGAAVPGARITLSITEQKAVRIQTYHVYDFISKQVIDTYGYRWDEVGRTTRVVSTDADGAFHLSWAGDADHDYQIQLSTPDARGRVATAWIGVDRPALPGEIQNTGLLVPYLETGDCLGPDWSGYGIGDEICLEMRTGAGPLPSDDGSRYLFFTTHQGLRQVALRDSPTFTATFGADDVPSTDIWAVRFTGSTFTPVEGAYSAGFDREQRRLTVALRPDRPRYAPGETVVLDVRTSDAKGTPVAATVVLRAVDEKLYAMGNAANEDPLWALYSEYLPSMLLWTHASHPVPFDRGDECGCGDTMGGGDDVRSDFSDVVLFRKVTTNAAGHARVSFRLSDDLTSWRVSGSATTSLPEAGIGSVLVPVGLPFFVETSVAPEYLEGDRPILRVRSYGLDLEAGDRVTYTVSSKSLGMAAITARGSAFGDVDVVLPPLTTGEHAVTIKGTVRRDGKVLTDGLTRRFVVVASRLTHPETRYTTLTTGLRPEGGAGWTTYVFSDAGRGRYLPLLESLSSSSGARIDAALAASIARDLLVDEFGVDRQAFDDETFDPNRYARYNGVSLLPYSSPDLALTARIALLAGDRFDRQTLRQGLVDVVYDKSATRERRIMAMAGRAGLGDPVLSDLRHEAADPDLTIRERLYLALGFAAVGDHASAQTIERDLLDSYGERRGATIRLRVGRSLDDTIEATALMAFLAVEVGEPFAPELQAYVEANPAVDELFRLQQVAFVARMLDRTPAAAARFAYSLDGTRSVVDLGPGDSFSLRLTPQQRRTLGFESLRGGVSLATSWQVPLAVSAIQPDQELRVTRTVLPSGVISDGTVVEVRLTATFGPQVIAGCFVVTDLVPSGMAPIAHVQGWWESEGPVDFISPFEVQAQRVSFCAVPPKTGSIQMRYFARVVSPGEYVWEPAIIQSAVAAESLNYITEHRVTIR